MIKYPSFSEIDEDTKQQYLKDLLNFEQEMKKLSLPIFLIYGTLLGALREHDFIAHDTDIDIAYLSNYHNVKDVQTERKDLIQYLTKKDMLREFNTVGIKVKYGLSVDMFDMWTSWTDGTDYYLSPFKKICSKDIVLPLKSLQFRNETFLIPNQSEQLLDILYLDWQKIIDKNQRYLKINNGRQ